MFSYWCSSGVTPLGGRGLPVGNPVVNTPRLSLGGGGARMAPSGLFFYVSSLLLVSFRSFLHWSPNLSGSKFPLDCPLSCFGASVNTIFGFVFLSSVSLCSIEGFSGSPPPPVVSWCIFLLVSSCAHGSRFSVVGSSMEVICIDRNN